MKKRMFILLAVFTAVLIAGCGSSESSSSGGGTWENVTLSGTLGTGTIGAMVTKATAAEGYTVVITDLTTNKYYSTATDADGSFSVDVPSGGKYMMGLVNDGSYLGPVAFDGSGDSIYPAITPINATDLGSITFDTTSGYGTTDSAPDIVDTDTIATASNGVPYGAGSDNDGKNIVPNLYSLKSNKDQDTDGIPDLFDADRDNNGIRDGIEISPADDTVVSDYVSQVYASSNIWAEHGATRTGSTQAEIA